MIGKIPIECGRSAARSRQRHIAVRPDEIQSIPGKAGGMVLLVARKDVQRHIVRLATGHELVVGCAVDVNLPFYACERLEIIDPVTRDPGQAISTMDMPGSAAA